MSAHYPSTQFTVRTDGTMPPATIGHNRRAAHVFDLHPSLHLAVFGGFFVYLGIMWTAFADPGLAIPFVIFVIFLAASVIVPGMWARIAPDAGPRETWADFRREGIDTASGRLTADAATAQVLIMPAMLVLWGIAVAVVRFAA